MRELLRRLPDLARGLCRIQYRKCTPQELVTLLKAFRRVATAFAPPHPSQPTPGTALKSRLLSDTVDALPRLLEPVNDLCAAVNMGEAAECREATMWADPNKYPDLEETNTVSARCPQYSIRHT